MPAMALDPPHDDTYAIECLTCHIPHSAAGTALTQVEGNANLCMSCHNPTGLASARSFVDKDQAIAGISGTSHRFDSGQSGHLIKVEGSNTSDGDIESGGRFTGRVPTVYNILITFTGDSGAAEFGYTSDFGGNDSGILTGDPVVLENGLQLRFIDDPGATDSFTADSQWNLYVHPEIDYPVISDPDWFSTTRPVGQRVMPQQRPFNTDEGQFWSKVVCSTCHDQHCQIMEPFDPDAPVYPFAGCNSGMSGGDGWGRHFQRIDNEANQLCFSCHNQRDVQDAALGSHPVRVTIPATDDFTSPAALPLDGSGQVVCMTCHAPHSYSGVATNDGYLLRQPIEDSTLCLSCHALADTAAGSHFDSGSGALWPGGEYGSDFPAHSSDKRGSCVNCHWPHGWPDDADYANSDYPRLWIERYDTDLTGRTDPDDAEDLCLTCHDATGPATSDIKADIEKGANGTDIFHHPVMDSEQSAGRTVECLDCHNPHEATNADRHAGVSGVDINGAAIVAGSRALEQQELCFKCHGDTYNSGRANTSNKRLDFGVSNSAYHPVAQIGRNQSGVLNTQLSGAGLSTSSTIRCTDCHNSDTFSADGPAPPSTARDLGVIVDSTDVTVGPHGSTNAPILRANFSRDHTSTGWNDDNAALCFRCHSSSMLNRTGPSNFYDNNINDKDNLHWVHLRDKDTTSSCMSCHYDIHSNISADNTQYRIDGVLYADNAAASAAGIKTHMVNFAPDVTATDSRAKPEWQLDTGNRTRGCYLSCHGEEMRPGGSGGSKDARYRPAAGGDETTWTY